MFSQDVEPQPLSGDEPHRDSAPANRLLTLPLLLAAVWTASGCSSDGGTASIENPPVSLPALAGDSLNETTTSPVPTAPDEGSTLCEVRYCEILAGSGDENSGTHAVWNTMGLNDCPQEAWDLVDLDAVKAQLGADQVETNGPRYRVLDDLASLGDRLDLPDGWSFTSRVLNEDLLVEDRDGIATVATDDLWNTYELAARD